MIFHRPPINRYIHSTSLSSRFVLIWMLLGFGLLIQAQAAEVAASPRETIICYISWFSPVGELNGTSIWKRDGYHYQRASQSGGARNYPQVPGVEFPQAEPAVGGATYYQLEQQCSSVVLRQMKNAGFSVVAFDMQPLPDYNPAQPLSERNAPLAGLKTFQIWLKEAEPLGLKMAPMPDIWNCSGETEGKIRPLTVDDWKRSLAGLLDLLPDSPALWKLDGRPVLLHFGTDCYREHEKARPAPEDPAPDYGWRRILRELKAEGRKLFFIADIRVHDRTQDWSQITDGAYMFAPASPTEVQSAQAVLQNALHIPYLWCVSPGYYRGKVAYTEPAFQRIHDAYLAAMKSGARAMYVASWNDYEEETDIGPTANKGEALTRVFAFYNEWFKTGRQPKASQDTVVLAYPMRIPDQVITPAPRYRILKDGLALDGDFVQSPPYSPKAFYWANLANATTLSLSHGKTVTLPAGVSFGELGPLNAGSLSATLGKQSIALPPIQRTTQESQRQGNGGLEFRYVTLPSDRITTPPH